MTPELLENLKKESYIDRKNVILAGIETHVCIQQTCLDLLKMDYNVFVIADAVSS